MNNTITARRLSVSAQALAALCAVIGAVALPQVFHLLGLLSHVGSALGEAFLPMHLPILLVGLLAGPLAGGVAGLVSPLISFALTGMPAGNLLPFMMVELCGYGLFAGLLRTVKMPVICKVLIAQIVGRAARAAALCIAVFGFQYNKLPLAILWKSIPAGIFGLCLQWALIPLMIYRINGIGKDK